MKVWLLASIITVGSITVVLAWTNRHENPLPADARAELVVVNKAQRLLTLYDNGQPLKSYPIALGRNPVGAKEYEGDKRTPEGSYRIDYRKANSGYYRALHISYPNAADTEAARKKGLSAGGAIMIHGQRNGFGWIGKLHRLSDWTLGCIAVTNREMAELWRAVPDGTPIELKP
ncbi:L,D-transpeptidase family protein [Azotobacter chroococcum]|uniref:L,D-transpeptidase family protein n=1 Tax=Azotobacter chroococcum TaxID=353 RepID=UPI000B615523|nr:L,D-transpeptidase family protein [Azotobacter chroococcum]ASL26795.1 hypothetical protein ACG10_11215 [Azotobacter chroococcum]